MHSEALTREGARTMTVCNACRYCEQYCPAFQAMEERLTFAQADLNYLANLCHGCGECLYACQYAPPHEFAIDVPRQFARLRVHSYESYAWPRALAWLFRRSGIGAALLLATIMTALLFGTTYALNGTALLDAGTGADFYAVIPHGAMAGLFGAVGSFALLAIGIAALRCARDFRAAAAPAKAREANRGGTASAVQDALTLRHLHVAGRDCVTAPEVRTPWRRVFHHLTFYGFLLCFASTSVATLYHLGGMPAPYAYGSLPVLLGTLGGIGIVAGCVGLLLQRRDPRLSDPAQAALDRSFLVLLLLVAATGLLLLALREQPSMGVWLIVHLGTVLALFVTLPYGKFVHGVYRTLALVRYRQGAVEGAMRDE
jgi:citrate/tricarballylate utilization protein